MPEDKACCLPPAAPIEAALPKILPELRRALDSGEQATYARFFLGGREQDIPSRSGYYVGYRVAAELGRSRSLQQLAVLKPAELRPLLDAALDSLTPRPGGP